MYKDLFTKFGSYISSPKDITGGSKPSFLYCLVNRNWAYLLGNQNRNVLSRQTINVRRKLNPVIKLVLPLFMKFRQIVEENNLVDNSVGKRGVCLPNKPVIWCANHSFEDDVAATVRVARHSYIFFGSLPAFYNTFRGIAAWANGVVMCNRKLKTSRRLATENAKRVLSMGADLIIFPEGTWNKTSEKLILNLWPGAYRIAQEKGCKIVPVVHYLRDPHGKRKNNQIHTAIGDPLDVQNLNEEDALAVLRDSMATLYYLMMERYGRANRKDLIEGFEDSDSMWESYVSYHTACVKYYDHEIELNADYRPKDIVQPEDVWYPIANCQNISSKNIQHILFARNVIEHEKHRDFQRRF